MMVQAELRDLEALENASLPSIDNYGSIGTSGEFSESFLEKIKNFLFTWHLPLLFIAVLSFGYLVPAPGEFLQKLDLKGICIVKDACVLSAVSDYSIFLIFILSGLKLETREIKKAFKQYKAVLLGLISILGISPLVGFITMNLPFAEQEFATGLSIFFVQATSLSSGPTIAAQADGNVALALLLTVLTNIIGVFTMPLFVTFILNQLERGGDQVEIETVPIIIQLLFLILVPLFIGKCLRYFKPMISLRHKYSGTLKIVASLALAVIIWLNISASKDQLSEIKFISLVPLFIPAIVVHLLTLCFNHYFFKFLTDMKQGEQRTMLIMTSAKSLSVSLTVLQLLDEDVIGSRGLVAIPMILCNFFQVIIDSYLAAKWANIPIYSLRSIG